MLYNINFDIATLFVCIFSIYCIIAKKGLVRPQNRVLLALCAMTFICAALDIAAVNALQPDSSIPYLGCYLLNLTYFLVHNAVAFVALIYVGHLTGENFNYSPYYYLGVSSPYVLLAIGLLTNHHHHFLFTITPDRIYMRETGFFLLYLVAAIYLLAIVVKLFRYRYSMDPSRRWMILLYLLSAVASLTVEYFIPNALVELFSQSIAILGVIFTIDNLAELTDLDTKAYNRVALYEDLHILFHAKQNFQIFIIKIPDMIKLIPSLGLDSVSKVIYDISFYLRSLPETTLYHCGEGVFIMTYMDASKREDYIQRITNRFHEPWFYEQLQVHLNMELCHAASPTDIKSMEDFFTVLQAPVKEPNSFTGITNVYDYQRYQRENQVLQAVRNALQNHSFEVYYQPIMDVANHSILSAEALIRLNDDNLGYIAPDEFIPIAERQGCIIEIGDYVMEEVCRFISENDVKDYGIQFIDINLSAIQCMDQKLAERFLGFMKKYHVHPNQLSFELSESAIIDNKALLPLMIERFSKRGVNITLDDYGTGNSNIATIFKLPFSVIRIDKNILWEAEKSQRSLDILKGTMKMIKSLNMKLLMEGIETEHQLNWLLDNGCDYCQGYYFSRALPGGDFLKYVSHFNNIEE